MNGRKENIMKSTATMDISNQTAFGPALSREFVTPEIAGKWLARMRRNRNIRWNIVEAIARDIAAGQWQINGATIAFGDDGLLDDGQHRLHAVIKAGIGVWMLVVRGISEAARPTVDSGISRTYADTLEMTGYANAHALAALTRRMWYWDNGICILDSSGRKSVQPTRQELETYLAEHELELTSAASVAYKTVASVMAPATFASVALILGRFGGDEPGEFLDKVATGRDLSAGDPILVLRNRLNRMTRQQVSATRMDQEIRRALTFTAWNHWIRGKTVTNIALPRDGLSNKNYPMPRRPQS